MKRYLESSIENMRDIGGYSVDEFKVAEGYIIRSNLPNQITNQDKVFLKNLGIKHVIDLRSGEELSNKPSVFMNDNNFEFYHLEMIGGREIPKTCDAVPISYFNMLEAKENIKKIFEILKKGEKVLYFCNAGKDRTGVVTALILRTLGVEIPDIAKDYVATKEYMENILKNNTFSEEIKKIITPREENIFKFFEYLNEKYVSVENYLENIGISKQDIELIRKNYLV